MAEIPIKQTRRWEDFKFKYTADNQQAFITSQRISKDESGNVFLPITSLLKAKKVTDTKTKLWGKPENLRKIEITYSEPKNDTQQAEITRYNPYPPLSPEFTLYFLEIREICKAKFNPYDVKFCTDYRGENRFTKVKPTRISDNN